MIKLPINNADLTETACKNSQIIAQSHSKEVKEVDGTSHVLFQKQGII
jgi:hypothetical protein